jgi:hypothetical protein
MKGFLQIKNGMIFVRAGQSNQLSLCGVDTKTIRELSDGLYHDAPTCFASPDLTTEEEHVQHLEKMTWMPGAYILTFNRNKATPSTELASAGNTGSDAWEWQGPVQGPYTRKMTSLVPGYWQKNWEQNMRDDGTVSQQAWEKFVADYFPSKETVAILLASMPTTDPTRAHIQAFWNKHFCPRRQPTFAPTALSGYQPSTPRFSVRNSPEFSNRAEQSEKAQRSARSNAKRNRRGSTPPSE